ncbi:MAG: hypothetical protein PHO30_08450 [Candidatus Omnitrophica bacterium]|nr:hypothetical protein [Candidatus Omnitrophota bacterium]
MNGKRGFTLIELQMAGLAMSAVLVATGIIFYFALGAIRYLHDAYTVFANANAAIKAFTTEVMVSNCYGKAQTPSFNHPQYSFYGTMGYIHPGGSGTEAEDSFSWMPTLLDSSASWNLDDGSGALYLRQSRRQSSLSGTTSTIAGDFPMHDIVMFYRVEDANGVGKLLIERQSPGQTLSPSGTIDELAVVAEYISACTIFPVAYNCLVVRVTCTGTIPAPSGTGGEGSGRVYQVTLTNAITLRCAPTVTPSAMIAGDLW